jgi:hypothetical protein
MVQYAIFSKEILTISEERFNFFIACTEWRRSGRQQPYHATAKPLRERAQTGNHFQANHREQKTQGSQEPSLPVEITGNLICVGPEHRGVQDDRALSWG